MKKQLIAEIAQQLKSFGYIVYLSEDGHHGFYTDGQRVVSFGGSWEFYVDFSGNYNAGANARTCGTGWGIAKECTSITAEEAEKYVKANAPRWATNGLAVTYTTPEQHLATYGGSSGYVEF